MSYIYKYVNSAGQIIYIGKSDAANFNRLKRHGRSGDNIPCEAWNEINSSKIYIFKCVDSSMSDILESEMIRRHKPKWNTAKTSDWTGFPSLPEPEWIPFVPTGNATSDMEYSYLLPPFDGNKLQKIKRLFCDTYKKTRDLEKSIEFLNNRDSCLPDEGKYLAPTITNWGRKDIYLPNDNLRIPGWLFGADTKYIATIFTVTGYGCERKDIKLGGETIKLDINYRKLHFTSGWRDNFSLCYLYLDSLKNILRNISTILKTYYPESLSNDSYKGQGESFYMLYNEFIKEE